MQSEEIVSIIIPAYNVENDLNNCISSIASQTYQSLEIILIDDGSTDSTGELCDLWAQVDCRVQVVHQKNRGMSVARNVGTHLAHGGFIAYIDADDRVGPRYIECLIDALKSSDVLISATGFVRYSNKAPKTIYDLVSVQKLSSEDAILSALNDQEVGFFAWGKLFDASLKPVLVFPEGRAYEDQAIMYKVFDYAKTIAYESACDYYYQIRPDSVSNRTRTNIVDSYQAFEEMLTYCKEKYPSLLGVVESRMLAACAEAYSTLMCANMRSQDDYYCLLKGYGPKAKNNKYLKKSIKAVYRLASVSRKLLDCSLKIFNKIR